MISSFDTIVQAEPLLRDKRMFVQMADPLLHGKFPIKGLYQALAIAALCLHEEASSRPLIGDVVTALQFLINPSNDTAEDSEESIPKKSPPPDSEIEREIAGNNNVFI